MANRAQDSTTITVIAPIHMDSESQSTCGVVFSTCESILVPYDTSSLYTTVCAVQYGVRKYVSCRSSARTSEAIPRVIVPFRVRVLE